jgi:hypothetical protein
VTQAITIMQMQAIMAEGIVEITGMAAEAIAAAAQAGAAAMVAIAAVIAVIREEIVEIAEAIVGILAVVMRVIMVGEIAVAITPVGRIMQEETPGIVIAVAVTMATVAGITKAITMAEETPVTTEMVMAAGIKQVKTMEGVMKKAGTIKAIMVMGTVEITETAIMEKTGAKTIIQEL